VVSFPYCLPPVTGVGERALGGSAILKSQKRAPACVGIIMTVVGEPRVGGPKKKRSRYVLDISKGGVLNAKLQGRARINIKLAINR